MRQALATWLLAAVAAAAGGCATTPLPSPGAAPTARVEGVPFHPQERHQCGPAALAMTLGWSGVAADPDALAPRLFVPQREGTLQPELLAQARQHDRLAYRLRPELDALLAELAAGHPVLVLQNLSLPWWPRWHYSVVIGYDAERRQVTLHSGTTAFHEVPLATFLRTWARGGNWALLTLPPGRLPASAEPVPYLAAAFDLQRVGRLEAAAAAYAAGLQRWPGHAGLAVALANRHFDDGRPAVAESVLARAVSLQPTDGLLLNNHAMVLAELGRWDEAVAAAERAMRFAGPHRAEVAATLAEIRCRAGGRPPAACR